MRAVEGTIEGEDVVRLTVPISLTSVRRVVVLIPEDDDQKEQPSETLLLSESALAQDWNRPEEDAAWSYLQSET